MIPSVIFNNRFIVIAGIIIILLSFLDSTVGSSFLYSYDDRSSIHIFTYFSIIFTISILCQIFLVFSIIGSIHSIANLRQRGLTIAHIFILVFVIFNAIIFLHLIQEIYIDMKYDLSWYVFIVVSNLSVSIIIVGILIFKFIRWSSRNRNIPTLVYSAAFIIFSIASLTALITIIQELEGRPSSITSIPDPWDKTSTRHSIFSEIYRISSIAMFVLVWFATSLILRSYSLNYTNRVYNKRYWILVSLPLVYFFVTSDFIANQLNSYIFEYPYLHNLFVYSFGGTKQSGGLFFAISFILMSKHASNQSLKTFLALSATGIMMLFSSLQISVLQLIPYPPFGLNTLSIMPIASYLLLIGLFYSAKSISFDRKILDSVKGRVKNEQSEFLRNIGSAEWSNNIEGAVKSIIQTTNESIKNTDSNLSYADIQRHVSEVMEEIERSRIKE